MLSTQNAMTALLKQRLRDPQKFYIKYADVTRNGPYKIAEVRENTFVIDLDGMPNMVSTECVNAVTPHDGRTANAKQDSNPGVETEKQDTDIITQANTENVQKYKVDWIIRQIEEK